MKILFPFVGDTLGGSHVATCLFIRHLLQHTAHEAVVVLHQKGALESYLKAQHIPYQIIEEGEVVGEASLLRQLPAMIKNIQSLKAFLQAQQIDLVHTNDLRMHLTWLLPSYKTPKVKHIWHQHSYTRSWRLALFSFFTNRGLTISRYCKQGFPFLFRRKAEIIYNPFEIPANQPHDLRAELNLNSEARLIGCVGNLTQQKRPDFFIDLAAQFCRESTLKTPLHFLLIGEKREPFYTDLQARVDALGLTDHVHFMGARFPVDPDVQALDVLVAPAVDEGLGRTLIEGMLCHVPVVAARSGGHVELVEDGTNGFLCAPDDRKAFSRKIECLLTDQPLRQSMIETAYAQAAARFSLKAYSEKLLSIYDALVKA